MRDFGHALNLSFILDRLSKRYIPCSWKGVVSLVDSKPQRDPALPFGNSQIAGTARTRQCYLIEVSLNDVPNQMDGLTPKMASIDELVPTDWEPMTTI